MARQSKLFIFVYKSVVPLLLITAGIAILLTHTQWLPYIRPLMNIVQNKHSEDSSSDDSPDSPIQVGADTLTLTPTAWKNIGLKTATVTPTDFEKVISVPAMVVERPGRSQHEITAPMTGIVTQVHPLERQAIAPGTALFDLRLTHEEVVTAQTDLLTNLQVLDVATRELQRLQGIGAGIVPGKRLIEQQYERDKAEGVVAAKRQSLLLHGMNETQVAEMERTRKVLREITIVAPPYPTNQDHAEIEHQYFVQAIKVNRGQSVAAGELLGVLADHCLLSIEGQAFAEDARRLVAAAESGATLTVETVAGELKTAETLKLKVQSVANEIDQQSRSLKFYLLLPNEISERASALGSGDSGTKEFIAWKYRPGQRMEAKIPTAAVMKNKIVLPPDAVVIDGPNAFVFEQNGKNFDRVDVQVLFRDKDHVVLENDGQLVGSVIAISGAYQMHLAMKNLAGGAIDPHAGHSH